MIHCLFPAVLGCVSLLGWRLVCRACERISRKLRKISLWKVVYWQHIWKWPGRIERWRHWWRHVTRWRHSNDVNGWGVSRTCPRISLHHNCRTGRRPGIWCSREFCSALTPAGSAEEVKFDHKLKPIESVVDHSCARTFIKPFIDSRGRWTFPGRRAAMIGLIDVWAIYSNIYHYQQLPTTILLLLLLLLY